MLAGMRIVAISDTHTAHGALSIPPCDLLVHAGDMTRRGKREELEAFVAWFAETPARAKVFVAGNHDRCCERHPEHVRGLAEEHGLVYLEDETTTVLGLKVHGSPVTPEFRAMAFNRARGPVIAEAWVRIPSGLDLLITHGPPAGLGDRTFTGLRVGCADLRARIFETAPRVHVFGHIHEAFGEYRASDVPTRFLNVCSRPLLPFGTRPPVVFDL